MLEQAQKLFEAVLSPSFQANFKQIGAGAKRAKEAGGWTCWVMPSADVGVLTFSSPTAQANGVFSPDRLRCVTVRVGTGSGRLWRVPEGSGRFRCRTGAGSGRFRRVLLCAGPEGSGGFGKVPGC